jgi:alpha-glucoside transport system substrate-binding protein
VLVAVALAVGGCGAATDAATPEPVRIFGPYRGAEAAHFVADLDAWAKSEGIEVAYTGTGSLASDLEYRVGNADPPDIALVPQPGLVGSLYRSGDILPLAPAVEAVARDNETDAELALGAIGGTQVGFPYRINNKSLVWYRPDVLASLGAEIPTSLDELEALGRTLQDQGVTPWCLGIQAERSTGWPATDWVEELIVREWGPDVYRDWVAGRVPFADPRIAESFATFRRLVLQPGLVAGGIPDVVSTEVDEAHAPLFTDPPGCALYHQAGFALDWFPEGTIFGADGDVHLFVLPAAEVGAAPPVLVGTDLAVAFDDRPDVEAVMAYLAGPAATETWTGAGGLLTPTVRPEDYPQPEDRRIAEALLAGDPLVIDGSDAMLPDIGTGLFWDQITRWVAGSIEYDELATTLDDARDPPESGSTSTR